MPVKPRRNGMAGYQQPASIPIRRQIRKARQPERPIAEFSGAFFAIISDRRTAKPHGVSSTAPCLHSGGTDVRPALGGAAPDDGETSVIGKEYFSRQVATLLKFAQSTNDPGIASALIEKAADLKFRGDREMPPSDAVPLAPDIEPPAAR
jgi:hypothetical protein